MEPRPKPTASEIKSDDQNKSKQNIFIPWKFIIINVQEMTTIFPEPIAITHLSGIPKLKRKPETYIKPKESTINSVFPQAEEESENDTEPTQSQQMLEEEEP